MPKSSHGAHHPADVADPVHRVAGLHVVGVHHVLRGLDREAAVAVDGALGPAGRARRVEQHQRGVGRQCARCRRSLGCPATKSAHDTSFRPSGARRRQARRRRPLARRRARPATAASAVAACATRCPRRQKPSAVNRKRAPESCRRDATASDAVAGEERQDDPAQLDDGEERGHQLGAHRHEERHAVARPEARRRQAVRALVGQLAQLAVGQDPHRALFALPAEAGRVGGVGVACHLSRQLWTMFRRPPTHQRGHAGPARQVENLAVRLVELDADRRPARPARTSAGRRRTCAAASSYVATPWRSMNAFTRLCSMWAGVGRQAISPPRMDCASDTDGSTVCAVRPRPRAAGDAYNESMPRRCPGRDPAAPFARRSAPSAARSRMSVRRNWARSRLAEALERARRRRRATSTTWSWAACCRPAPGMNVARQVAIRAGVPVTVPAETVNRVLRLGPAGRRARRRGDSRRLREGGAGRRHRVDEPRAVSAARGTLGPAPGTRRGARTACCSTA